MGYIHALCAVVFNMTHHPSRNPAIITREVIYEMVLLNPEKPDSPLLLNETAVHVWMLLDGTHSLADVVEIIAFEFDVPTVQIESDILELFQKLVSMGALINVYAG